MRKLRLFEHSSLDGVIQHSADNGDFPMVTGPRPIGRPLAGTNLRANGGHFDLLLGRRTYDMWSGFWPKAQEVRWRTTLMRRPKMSQEALHAVLNLRIRIQRHAAFGFLAFATSDCAACV